MTMDDVLQMIQEATGFRDRDPFETEEEVVLFFSPDTQIGLHGESAVTDATTLQFWADVIVGSGHHCTFPGEGFDEANTPE